MKFLCFILSLLIISETSAQNYLANVQFYGIEDGLSHREVFAIHQDRKGFIWVGTKYGLNRFDGHSFKVYTKENDGLASNTVHYILEDDAEKLWLFDMDNWWYRTSTKHISIFDQKTNTISTFEAYFKNENLPFLSQDISYFLAAADGKIVFHTFDKRVFIYRGDSGFQEVKFEEKEFTSSTFTPNNTLVGTRYNLLLNGFDQLVEMDTLGHVLQRTDLPKDYKKAIILGYSEDHKLWFYNPTEASEFLLSYLDTKQNKIIPYNNEDEILKENTSGDWTSQLVFWQKNNCFWYKQGSKLLIFSPETGIRYDFSVHHPKLLNAAIQRFFFDRNGSAWIGTASGLYRIELNSNPFTQFLNQDYNAYEINNAYSCRGIWTTEDMLYVNTYKGRREIRFSDDSIMQIPPIFFKGRGDVLKRFGILSLALYQDQQQNLWFGDIGLIKHDKLKGKESFFPTYPPTKPLKAWSIYEGEGETIWIGTEDGLAYLENGSNEIKRIDVQSGFEDFSQSFIYAFVKSQKGHVWLSTTSGLYSWLPESGLLNRYWTEGNTGFKIPSDNIQHLYEDDEQALWLATLGDGLVKLELDENMQIKTSQQFTIVDGLSNNNLYSVYADQQDQLWMSSDYGIIQFDKNNHKARAYLPKDGITHHEFNRIAHHQSKDGKLYFGSINGVTAFHPKDVSRIKEEYNIPLEIIEYKQYDGRTEEVLDYTTTLLEHGKIILEPGDRFDVLSFALLEYIDDKNTQYRYKIEGLQKDWIHIQDNNIRLYGLPYGSYKIVIQGQGADGRFSVQELNIPIDVLSPFYAKTWFKITSLGFVLFFIFSFFNWRTRSLKKQQKILEQEVKERTQTIRKQAEKLQQLDKVKSRFFANISHELRTPLTLVLGPIGTLLKNKTLHKKESKLLKIARSNGRALLNLTNEILDLSKMESGKLELHEEPVVLHALLLRVISSFESLAEVQNIQLQFEYLANQNLQLNIDINKFQKVINNLLSNAFKFTPKGGIIALKVLDQGHTISLSVSDTGRGIHPDDLPNIFNRFYQSQQANAPVEGGTGIGLALCNEYSKLFNGSLSVKSKLNKGTVFTFQFPKKEMLQNVMEENVSELDKEAQSLPSEKNDLESLVLNHEKKDKKEARSTILLVEDNPSLRDYIQLVLKERFNVVTAENGEEALNILGIRKSQELLSPKSLPHPSPFTPDLIISDIMMPIMDGFQLLEKLKSNDHWRHIPIIMLTARAAMSDKLKALRIGVDDYLTKPFEEEELLARIGNLLRNRKERKVWIEQENTQIKDPAKQLSETAVLSQENAEWLIELERIIKDNQKDSLFNVERLSDLLFLSRRQLQRRIKQCTGLSPLQYIQESRLQLARELLERRSKSSVKATSYEVGIKDVKYFSQQFKKRFGKLPSAYF